MTEQEPEAATPERPNHKGLIPALVAATHELPRVLKTREAVVGKNKDTGITHKAKYANLADIDNTIRDTLFHHGLTYSQHPQAANGNGAAIRTVLYHETGDSLDCGTLFVPSTKPDAQGIGSAVTYARRHGLCAALGIVTEDDDGRAASEQPKQPRGTAKAFGPAGGETPTPAKIKSFAARLWTTYNQKGMQAVSDAYATFDPPMRQALMDTLTAIQDQDEGGGR